MHFRIELFWNWKEMVDNTQSLDHGCPSCSFIWITRSFSTNQDLFRTHFWTFWATLDLNTKSSLLHPQVRWIAKELNAILFHPPLLTVVQPQVLLSLISQFHTIIKIVWFQIMEVQDAKKYFPLFFLKQNDSENVMTS